MRSSLTSTLTLLLPSLAMASTRSDCIHQKSEDLVKHASCAEHVPLRYCLSTQTGEMERQNLNLCLTAAGCSEDEATKEIDWIFQHCTAEDELKRRRPEPMPAPTPMPDPQATTTAAAGTTTGSLQCSTATTVEIDSCKPDNKYVCSKVQTTTMVCAAENVCMQDKAGNNLCMKRQNNLTTSGAVVSIFLAIVLAIMLTAIVFLCCKDRREQKRLRAKSEAAAIAKANAIERPQREQQRLVQQQQQQQQRPQQGGANPFAG